MVAIAVSLMMLWYICTNVVEFTSVHYACGAFHHSFDYNKMFIGFSVANLYYNLFMYI